MTAAKPRPDGYQLWIQERERFGASWFSWWMSAAPDGRWLLAEPSTRAEALAAITADKIKVRAAQ